MLAPHCDDETFGCAVTIARRRAAGSRVTVVVVADDSAPPPGDPSSPVAYAATRREEAVTAVAHLGVHEDDIVFLGFRDGSLTDDIDAIARALTTHLRERSPADVMVTSVSDRHPDHAALGRIARRLADQGVVDGELYEYAIWQRIPPLSVTLGMARAVARGSHGFSDRRSRVARQRPRIVRTDGYLDTKLSAISVYASQLPHLPAGFVRSFLQPVEVFAPVAKRE